MSLSARVCACIYRVKYNPNHGGRLAKIIKVLLCQEWKSEGILKNAQSF
jgi:hypothetical protein